MKKLLLLPALLLCFASCATKKSAYQVAGEWNVTKLGEKSITPVENQTPFLGFDLNEGRVYGFTGCNRLTGGFEPTEFVKGKPNFTPFACTRMFCQEDKYETEFLKALSEVKASEMKDGKILLKDQEGDVLVVLEKKAQ